MTNGPTNLNPSLREFIEHEIDALDRLIEERFARRDQALRLQAEEYARRLHDLNGEYQRDRQRQTDFISSDKYEDKMSSEQQARTIALQRIDEKFEDYVKRYEQRQREVDLLLQAHAQSAANAEREAERTAQQIKDESAEQARKMNRNMGIGGLILTTIIVVMNLIGAI